MRTDTQIPVPDAGLPLTDVVSTRREIVHHMRASQTAVNQPRQDTIIGSNSGGVGEPVNPIDIRPPLLPS